MGNATNWSSMLRFGGVEDWGKFCCSCLSRFVNFEVYSQYAYVENGFDGYEFIGSREEYIDFVRKQNKEIQVRDHH